MSPPPIHISMSTASISPLPTPTGENNWKLCGSRIPRPEVVYFSQVIIIYITVITCIINLSINNSNNELWIALMGSCLGYILPNPSIGRKKLK